jgi:hypothetical protein
MRRKKDEFVNGILSLKDKIFQTKIPKNTVKMIDQESLNLSFSGQAANSAGPVIKDKYSKHYLKKNKKK